MSLFGDSSTLASASEGSESTANDSINTITISVGGMTCASCVQTVTDALLSLKGVVDAKVSLVMQTALVTFDEKFSSPSEIVERVEDCGFDSALLRVHERNEVHDTKISSITVTIGGMTCASCSMSIENALLELPGVQEVTVSLAMEEAKVVYDAHITGPRAIVTCIEDCGFDATLQNQISRASQIESLTRFKEITSYKRDFLISLIFTIPIMLISHLHIPALDFLRKQILPGLFVDDLVQFILSSFVQFTVGRRFYYASFKVIRHKAPTMDVLVCVSTSSAYIYSLVAICYSIFADPTHKHPSTLWDTSTMIFSFILCGRYLENKAKGKTSEALSSLMSLVPSTATVVENGEETEIASDLLQVDDVVVVRPGEKIAADGIVIEGVSYVVEAHITGESLPITKKEGDFVIGGGLNGPGELKFRVINAGQDTKLAQIVQVVQDAQTSRAPVQRIADYFASFFVPAVLVLGFGTFLVWMVLSSILSDPPHAFKNGKSAVMVSLQLCISVIVVACPCALGLATPTAVMVGTGVGAKHGILIKGGSVLETAHNISTVLFDKTGTITIGEMSVSRFQIVEKLSPTDFWAIIGSIEERSEHPIAKALVEKARSECHIKDESRFDGTISEVSNFASAIGEGVEATVILPGGTPMHVLSGNAAYLKRHNVKDLPKIADEEVETSVLVAFNGKYAGLIFLCDTIQPSAKKAVAALHSLGVEVGLVSGDRRGVALKVAEEAGIPADHVWAEVSPKGKVDIVRSLQLEDEDDGEASDETIELSQYGKMAKYHRTVAMVGDGVNDSPALAAAAIGIAVGSAADVTMEAANIVLIRDSALMDVALTIDLSRAVFDRIKLNLGWALVYNLFMIPFAMGFFLPFGFSMNPLLAGMCMAFSSLSVVLSSLSLKRWKPPKFAPEHHRSFYERLMLIFGRRGDRSKSKYQTLAQMEV